MNELQILPNPDNVPGAVTTGYQRQNTNMFAIQTGLDTTEPFDNGEGVINIPAGGIVEVNGVMFKIITDVTLIKPNANIVYWIEVIDNGDGNASFNLVTRPGKWNPSKKGCYTDNNNRTLDWVSLGDVDLTGINEDAAVFSQTVKGYWDINLPKGWYAVDMASGGGGGNGGRGGDGAGAVGGGGVANQFNRFIRSFFHGGKSLLFVKVGGSGFNGGSGASGGSGSGNNGGSGGGGGSGSGEETSCGDITTGSVRNGSGGNGGTGSGGGTSGGAGASGAGRNGLNGSAGSAGAAQGPANGGNGANQGNWGAGGGGGGAGGINGVGSNGGAGGTTTGTGNRGGGGGGGGGAGSTRLPGAAAAGFCNIFSLSN